MKGYGQFCPVAKAAEIVAERWTPLVLRELLCGSHRFADLHRGVPLMSRALLAQRLRQLEDAGIIRSTPKTRGRGREYALTPDSAAFLDRGSPAYLGGALEFLLTGEMRECFRRLTDAVRRGGTAVSDEGTVSDDNPVWVEFARAMAPLMRMPAQLLADLVGGDGDEPLRVLDVAAGHGVFGITVAERYPRARVTALDWRNVLAVAEENATRAGLAELSKVDPDLPRYTAVRAYLLERAGDLGHAAELYAEASHAATNAPERDHLAREAARVRQLLRP